MTTRGVQPQWNGERSARQKGNRNPTAIGRGGSRAPSPAELSPDPGIARGIEERLFPADATTESKADTVRSKRRGRCDRLRDSPLAFTTQQHDKNGDTETDGGHGEEQAQFRIPRQEVPPPIKRSLDQVAEGQIPPLEDHGQPEDGSRHKPRRPPTRAFSQPHEASPPTVSNS